MCRWSHLLNVSCSARVCDNNSKNRIVAPVVRDVVPPGHLRLVACHDICEASVARFVNITLGVIEMDPFLRIL